MATDQRNLPGDITLLANFRAWGEGISQMLATAGLTRASDTGQIDWATASLPAVGAYAGYEIWRFNDSLQATCPVFIKLEYGSGDSAAYSALRATICTATNGAGVPGGRSSGAMQMMGYPSAGLHGTYVSAGPGRMALIFNYNTSSSGYTNLLLVERTRKADGTITDDGFYYYLVSARYANSAFQFITFARTSPAAVTYAPVIGYAWGGIPTLGGNVLLGPIVIFRGVTRFGVTCFYRNVDIPTGVPITVNHLGAARVYLPLSNGNNWAGGILYGGSDNYSPAIPWE